MDLSAYLRWARVERGLSPATIEAYTRELHTLASGSERLHELQTDDLRAVLHARGGAPSTVARRLAAWRSYYGWLVRTGQRDDDPTRGIDRPRVRRGIPRPVEDLDALLGRLDPVMQAVVVFLAETGLRVSEACSVSERLPAPETITVLGKGGKERHVPLSDLARAALDELGGHIPLAKRTVQRRLQLAGSKAHALRHTFASDLAEDDVDISVIQKLLGHASPATTLIYAEVSQRRMRAAIDRRRR